MIDFGQYLGKYTLHLCNHIWQLSWACMHKFRLRRPATSAFHLQFVWILAVLDLTDLQPLPCLHLLLGLDLPNPHPPLVIT